MNKNGDVKSPAKNIKRRTNFKNLNHIKRNHGGKTNRKKIWRKKNPNKKKNFEEFKKKCTCYICQKPGHIAPECPEKGKDKYKKETKMFLEMESKGFEPYEYSDSSEEELFEIVTESDTEESD